MDNAILPAIAALFSALTVFFIAYAIYAPIIEKRRSGPAGPAN